MKNLVPFLLFFLCSSILFAQSKKDVDVINPKKGKKAIILLKEGTLIVRLSKYDEKIKWLQEHEGKERAVQEQARIDQANKGIIADFAKVYDYSKIVFTYGDLLDEYLHQDRKDVFLNENLLVDPNIKIKEGPVLILASKSTTNFRLHDMNFTQLTNPSVEFISHHMDEDYHKGIDAVAQEVREHITRHSTAEEFNKKLHFYFKRKSLF